ncbi:MAG: pyridoxal-phosphate dependent enzyme [Muribaculaceae bacterium]|nr:pyridoxal-phosphate dependent enzyme [Muribaculaceae bacterium]MDE5714139.1 pyridoxal-phosphate dependent enzyme [Muribaculaceae bacterium]
MNHLTFLPTPLIRLDHLSTELGKNIFCKRDDLFQCAGGGSKARMLQYILADTLSNDFDVLVTAGGPCSNFNRACALMCAKIGLPMHLIEYTDNKNEYDTSLNYFVCSLAGMIKTRCQKSEVVETIGKVIESYREQKKKIFHIYGGGKSLQGIYAYYDAVKELADQTHKKFDEVYIACGTGTTLTGISAGFQEYYPGTKIHAISVARNKTEEWPVLEENIQLLNTELSAEYDLSNIIFHDNFICGGYGKYNKVELEAIRHCISSEGILVDPIYSGKAFWGMCELLKTSEANNVLFWNTGAVFNLLQYKNEFNLL